MSDDDPTREGPVRPAPQGARANAVPPPAAWAALVEVDHRVSQPLLDSLEDAGVAAYAEPRLERKGPYLDSPVPSKPVDRLYVDATRTGVAEAVVTAELPGLLAEMEPGDEPELDPFDAIVAAWDTVPETPSWPEQEDFGPARAVEPEPDWQPAPAPRPRVEEEHFVPPPPPPAPPAHPVTRYAVLAVCAGLFVLVGLPLFGTMPSTPLSVLGAISLIAGLATLFWRMRDAPSVDDGPDDGAVV
ncbi:MAG TPA: hypothetical protein VFQ85_16175 [Mycobacteriales bacterium]|jgi:hypothetical protein|nr:hypothetical protein [Mycobacteriales bacterium]